MRQVKLFIAMSLDGFIADTNDSVAWLDNVEGLGDNGYKTFYNTVDTLIMGRRTYDWVMAHTDEYPYKGKTSYVLSTKDYENTRDVKYVKDAENLVRMLKNQKGKDIWLVGGGLLVQHFLRTHLIDEIILTLAPVVLGAGIPLFKDVSESFEQVGLKAFNQFTQIHYRIKE